MELDLMFVKKNIYAQCAEITAASEDIDKSKFCYILSK
jgi:hypothetical protein